MGRPEVRPNAIYAQYLSSYLTREGISLSRYARLVGANLRTVEKWVNGETRCPQVMQWVKLCKIHGVDFDREQDMGFTPRRTRSLTALRRYLEPGDEDVMLMLRRDLFGVTAGVIYGASTAGPIARMLETIPGADVNVGLSDLTRLEESRNHVGMSAGLVGGGAFGPKKLHREFTNSVGFLRGRFATDEVRAKAHTVVSGLVRNLGWSFYDLGQHDQARRMWVASLAIAREAEPEAMPFLQANTLCGMAHQAVTLERYQDALELLGFTSSKEMHLTARMRSKLNGGWAGALAGLGNVGETRRRIALAEEFADAPQDERDLVWNGPGLHYDGADASAEAGHALARLALRHEALRADALAQAHASLRTLTAAQGVPRARVQNTVAWLHAANRDAAATEEAGWAALEAARRLRSPRVVGELVTMRHYLSRLKPGNPGITHLDQEIRATQN